MTGEPVTLRLAAALAGRGSGAAGPREWSGEGSWTLRAGARLAELAKRALAPLDGIGAALAARPLLVVAGAVVAVPVSQIAGAPGVGVAAAALAALSAVLAVANSLHQGPERGAVIRALLVGAALRLAFGAVISAQGGFPDETNTYHPIAADAASCWRAGGPDTMAANVIVQGRAAYFHLLAAVYALFGPSMAAGRVLGGAIGLVAALAAGEVARALGGARAAAIACALLALHPEHALWSVTLARDTLTTSCVLVTLGVALARPGTLLRGTALVAAIPLAVVAMNSFVVAGALGATLVAMLLAEAFVAQGTAARRAAAVAASLVVAAAALVFVGNRYGAWFSPEMFTNVRGKAIGTEADFLPSLEFSNWFQVLAYLPLGAAFVFAAPWPWDAVHANRAAYGVCALVGLAISAAGVAGLASTARRRPSAAAPVILFCLLLLLLLAALEANSGIVVRHRLPLTACLVCGAGAAFAGLRREP